MKIISSIESIFLALAMLSVIIVVLTYGAGYIFKVFDTELAGKILLGGILGAIFSVIGALSNKHR